MRNLLDLLQQGGDDSEDSDENQEVEREENDERNERRRRIPINYIFLQMLQQLHDRENSTHEELLKNLTRYEKELKEDTREYQAFKEIRRDYFVPEKYKDRAFNDCPLDIEELNTNLSSPHIYPKCILLLDLDHTKNQSILDIGCGTGWFSVLSAHVGWDLSDKIIEAANKNLLQFDESLRKRITYRVRNAFWPDYTSQFKTFDRIHVGASIPVEHRFDLYKLLNPNGKLVSPIAEGLFVVTNDPEKGFVEKSHLDVRYRMLIMPEKIPIWIPKLSVHQKYPPVIKEQIFCLIKIYYLRDSLFSYLPLEILYQILSWLYRNPSNSYDSSYLNFLKQNEIQFRRTHKLERHYNVRFESSESDDDENNEDVQNNDNLNDDENIVENFEESEEIMDESDDNEDI